MPKTFNTSALLAPDSPGAAPTLFDPYLSAGQAWQLKSPNDNTPQLWLIGPDQAIEHLTKLAQQFQTPTPGWKALLLAPPGLQVAEWAASDKHDLLYGLLPDLLKATHTVTFHSFCYLLPDNRVALVVHHANSADLVPVVYRLAGLLVGPDQAPRTNVTLLDLGQHPTKLAAWPLQVQAALALRAHQSEEQQTQAVLQRLQASLTPAVLAPAVARRAKRRKPEVMIVEDDPSTALLLEMLLEGLITTVSSANAVQAAQNYEIHAPDLVLLDLGLPDVGGLELLQIIRQADPAARVVILTATATKANLEAARQFGAVGFMAKPFTRAKLQETLQQHGVLKSR